MCMVLHLIYGAFRQKYISLTLINYVLKSFCSFVLTCSVNVEDGVEPCRVPVEEYCGRISGVDVIAVSKGVFQRSRSDFANIRYN